MAKTDSARTIPPYLPYETFISAIAHLKATAVPSRIDKDAFPRDMHSLQRGQVQSAMKFLGLIDAGEHTKESLRSLVAAYGTDEWQQLLRDLAGDKYVDIIGDLDLDTATQKQLDERFRTVVSTDQMLMKSVRFYLAMLTDAGLTFSPHFGRGRRNSSAGTPRKKKVSHTSSHRREKKKPPSTRRTEEDNDNCTKPEGAIDFPIPIGDFGCFIRVPLEITERQLPMVTAMYDAVVALAKQNSAQEMKG